MKKEFHHIGLPTTSVQPGETYLPAAKVHITDATKSEHRIEWLRFETGSPLPAILQSTGHVAFTVEKLEDALAGQQILVEPFSPMPGLRVAFIQDGAAPVEFLEFAQ